MNKTIKFDPLILTLGEKSFAKFSAKIIVDMEKKSNRSIMLNIFTKNQVKYYKIFS